MRTRDMFRSAAIWAGFAGVTLVSFPPMLLGYPLVLVDPNRALSDAYFRTIGRALVRLNPMWSVSIQGREHLEYGGPFVIVVNHQSLADLIVVCFLHHRTKFLGKASLFKLPIFGWMLRIAGEVSVERGDRESGSKALRELRQWLARGVSVCVFPEGTRSPDASIAPFKVGAFKLAIEAGAPILPVVLSGAASLLPKNSLIFDQRADIRARVLPPFSTRGRTISDSAELAEQVRSVMMDALSDLDRARKEWLGEA